MLCATDFAPYQSEDAWVADIKSGSKLWDANTGLSKSDIRFRFAPDCKSVLVYDDPDGQTLSTASKRGVELRAARTGKLLRDFKLKQPVREAEFSSDGIYIYALDDTDTLWKIRVR